MIRFVAFAVALAAMPMSAEARNVVLFIADGLRAGAVDADTAPSMAELRSKGVTFANSFSLYPTFTMVNAAAFATGHLPGDTGIYANTFLVTTPMGPEPTRPSTTPFIEENSVLKSLNTLYANGRSFLPQETLIGAARRAGYVTAAVGKVGPAALQDLGGLNDPQAIIIDDATGREGVRTLPISEDLAKAIAEATGAPAVAAPRGRNDYGGSCDRPGTTFANVVQQAWFTDVATKVLLPRFKASGKPFFLVFWSRDPDGTQHNHGDAPHQIDPGINGPTSLAAVRNADNALAAIRATLRDLGLEADTDIIVGADHGFSSAGRESQTSVAMLPCGSERTALIRGFLGFDIARELDLPAFDPDSNNRPAALTEPPRYGNALIGRDPLKPEVVVTANGGSDMIFLPGANRRELAERLIKFLLKQDYVSGIFVDDSFGKIPGTLPHSTIGFVGIAQTTRPALVVNFRSYEGGCANPTMCGVTVVDGNVTAGQGMHGSFSRADTANFMAAMGPSFKTSYVSRAPASNADVAMTIARILGLKRAPSGKLTGRVLTESLVGGKETSFRRSTIRGPAADGLATTIIVQSVGNVRYLEAGGFPGRTLGLGKN